MNRKLIIIFFFFVIFFSWVQAALANPPTSWCTYTGKQGRYSDGKCYYCYRSNYSPALVSCITPTQTKKPVPSPTLTSIPTQKPNPTVIVYQCRCVSGYWAGSGCDSWQYGKSCAKIPTPSPTLTTVPTQKPTPTVIVYQCRCVNGFWSGNGCDGWQHGRNCGVTPTQTPIPANINSQVRDTVQSCQNNSFSCQDNKKTKCINGMWIVQTVCSQGCQEVNGEFYCVEELNALFQKEIGEKMVACQRICEEKDIGTCLVDAQGGVDCVRRVEIKQDQVNAVEENCGGRWGKCCRRKTGGYCQTGLKCSDVTSLCLPDESYEKAQASVKLIQQTETTTNDLQFILQQNLGNDAEAYQYLNKLFGNSCGDCDGSCLYQEKEKKFSCVALDKLNDYYQKTIQETESGKKGDFGQACKGVWWSAGLKKVCNNEFLICVDNICQLSEGGKNVVANNLTVESGANTETAGIINTNLFSSSDTLTLAGNSQFAKSGCIKNNSYYFQNGACWQCIDSVNKIITGVSSELCISKDLAQNLPGSRCQADGGYCADKKSNCINKVESDCISGFICCDNSQYKGNTMLPGLNENCKAEFAGAGHPGKYICAPGLTCWGDEHICRDYISLSYDKSYANPASAIEGVGKVPLIGGLINGILSPIINVVVPSTKQAAEIRAKMLVDTVDNLGEQKLSDSKIKTSSQVFINSVDGTAKTLATIEVLRRIEEKSGQSQLKTFFSADTVYKTLAYAGAATSVYTKGMPLIGDNKNSTAFLDYAQTQANIDNNDYQGTSGKVQELGARIAGSAKFGGQIAFVVADVATLGFGPSLTAKAGEALSTKAVRMVGDEIAEKSLKEVIETAPRLIKDEGLKGVLAIGSHLSGSTLKLPTVAAEKLVSWELKFGSRATEEGVEAAFRFKPVAFLENAVGTVIGAPIIIPSMALQFTPGLTKAAMTKLAPELLPKIETGLAKLGLVSEDAIVRRVSEEFIQQFTKKGMDSPSLSDNISTMFKLAEERGFKGDIDAFRTVVKTNEQSFMIPFIKPAEVNTETASSIKTLFENPPVELGRGKGDENLILAITQRLRDQGLDQDRALSQVVAVKKALAFGNKWGVEMNSDELAAFTKIAAAAADQGKPLTLLDDAVQALAENKTLTGGLLYDGLVTRPTVEGPSLLTKVKNTLDNLKTRPVSDTSDVVSIAGQRPENFFQTVSDDFIRPSAETVSLSFEEKAVNVTDLVDYLFHPSTAKVDIEKIPPNARLSDFENVFFVGLKPEEAEKFIDADTRKAIIAIAEASDKRPIIISSEMTDWNIKVGSRGESTYLDRSLTDSTGRILSPDPKWKGYDGEAIDVSYLYVKPEAGIYPRDITLLHEEGHYFQKSRTWEGLARVEAKAQEYLSKDSPSYHNAIKALQEIEAEIAGIRIASKFGLDLPSIKDGKTEKLITYLEGWRKILRNNKVDESTIYTSIEEMTRFITGYKEAPIPIQIASSGQSNIFSQVTADLLHRNLDIDLSGLGDSNSLPMTGTIEINRLRPHESGYNSWTVPRLEALVKRGQELDPVKITIYKNELYTYDGANRITAYLHTGEQEIQYEFTDFSNLAKDIQDTIIKASTGMDTMGRTIPAQYTADYPSTSYFKTDTLRDISLAEEDLIIFGTKNVTILNPEETINIVSKARITGNNTIPLTKEINGNRIVERNLEPINTQIIIDAGLAPVEKVTIGEVTVNISPVYKLTEADGNRLAVTAYIEKDGQIYMRSFVKSDSQSTWRVVSHRKQNGEQWFGKGYGGEDSVILPFELQVKLNTLSEKPIQISGETATSIFWGNIEIGKGSLPSDNFIAEVNNETSYKLGHFTETTKAASGEVGVPESWVWDNPNEAPDFNKTVVIATNVAACPQASCIATQFIVRSKDNTINYIFFRDNKTGNIWVGGTEFVDSPINSYGIREKSISLGNLAMPLYEYTTQLPAEYIGSNAITNYMDASPYTSKLQINIEAKKAFEEISPFVPQTIIEKAKSSNPLSGIVLTDNGDILTGSKLENNTGQTIYIISKDLLSPDKETKVPIAPGRKINLGNGTTMEINGQRFVFDREQGKLLPEENILK